MCQLRILRKGTILKISSKLANSATSRKTYWSFLKTFLNNKKIPYVPPLILENNSSVLLNNVEELTNKSLDSVNFSSDGISKNKAHSHEMLSILLELCGNSICKPLVIL